MKASPSQLYAPNLYNNTFSNNPVADFDTYAVANVRETHSAYIFKYLWPMEILFSRAYLFLITKATILPTIMAVPQSWRLFQCSNTLYAAPLWKRLPRNWWDIMKLSMQQTSRYWRPLNSIIFLGGMLKKLLKEGIGTCWNFKAKRTYGSSEEAQSLKA